MNEWVGVLVGGWMDAISPLHSLMLSPMGYVRVLPLFQSGQFLDRNILRHDQQEAAPKSNKHG